MRSDAGLKIPTQGGGFKREISHGVCEYFNDTHYLTVLMSKSHSPHNANEIMLPSILK